MCVLEKISRRTIITVLAISIVVLLAIGYVLFQDAIHGGNHWSPGGNFEYRDIPESQNWVGQNIAELGFTLEPIPVGEKGGTFLGIVGGEQERGSVSLAIPQDTITFIVGNGTPIPLNFILKVFYNYEEVAFTVLETGKTNAEFVFTLDASYYVYIPILLPDYFEVNDTLSKLTASLVTAPEHHIAGGPILIPGSTPDEGYKVPLEATLNFEISYGTEDNLALGAAPSEISAESEVLAFSVYVNPNPPPAGTMWGQDEVLTVDSGEEVEMAFFASPEAMGIIAEPVSDYLVLAMLDWSQVLMNGKPYLWVDVTDSDPNFGQHVNFSIVVPDEPGFYEFLAILVPNPTHRNSDRNYFLLETFRFTIEVVE